MSGDDLSALIARGPLAPEDAIALARQIADALEAAHDKNVIHRDLKPANVKVAADGTVKVLEFGLAQLVDAGDSADSGPGKEPAATPALARNSGVLTCNPPALSFTPSVIRSGSAHCQTGLPRSTPVRTAKSFLRSCPSAWHRVDHGGADLERRPGKVTV